MENAMTSPSLVFAAALILFIGVVHSWLGERRLIGPLLAADYQTGPLARRFARDVFRFAWHITTLAWIGMGLVLAALALAPLDRPGRITAAIIGVVFVAHGLVVLIFSRGRHLAWPLFLAVGVLCFVPLL
jgi:hypothetical protein